jgi:hypothetical protein
MGNGQIVDYEKEKVLPEYMVVKREILQDFFYLKDLMFEAQRRPSLRSLDMIRAQILVFYATIRSKKGVETKCKTILQNPLMKKLDKAVTKEGLDFQIDELFQIFKLLQGVLDTLGLTQISYMSKDPGQAYDY